ncbi:LLM class flavin-dependent oxidoreductase [Phenylobacterium sp.]|uniref:LLM class flavin-dependent oxidoreductase n=1 Tax=Phenylobacterium sp. TaxID=1871053 RepID=UPI0012027966|nr:LLM class flavin-dependent oxidoreductase [Phenylobacterium sp.]THD61572.1 MAG: LLM class flavin-dependent oxidoreductase [Phenylobacterium sp.]
MPVEFIGFIGANGASETHANKGPALNVAYVEAIARAHDAGGFDRALVAFGSTSPESQLVVAHAASVTKRLGFMIAHRPGFTAPTVAARQLATLDQFTGGRIAVHIITGGSDDEMKKDGDHLTKAERYARTDEYLEIVRQEWTSERPFDHAGKYYNVVQAFGAVKPFQKPHLPIYFGGSSDEAIPVAGKHADIYALWGETQAQVRETIARVRAAAARHGRTVRFSLSLRPVLAETEDAAWARADDIVAQTIALREKSGLNTKDHAPPNAGSQRLLQAAAQGTRLDKRLWTGVAAVTGAQGNSTGLVGTPDQVAEALLDYYDLGVTTFLIRGFDPLDDAVAYGRHLIPRVRELVAARDARPAQAVG